MSEESGSPGGRMPSMAGRTTDLAALLRLALEQHQRGRLDAAGQLYRDILGRHPDSTDALHLLGVVLSQQRDFRGASLLIGRSLALNPGQPLAQSNFARVLLALKQAAQALTHIDRALTLKPDFAEAHHNRGNILCALGRSADALESYRRAAALQPDNYDALLQQGNLLRELQQPEAALRSYDGALSRQPNWPLAELLRADLLIELGRFHEADERVARAARSEPRDAESLCALGIVLLKLGREESAMAALDRALVLDPAHERAALGRGRALLTLGRVQEALETFDGIMALNPDAADAHNGRGNALRLLSMPVEALASFDRALLLKADFAAALNNRAGVLRDLGRAEESAATFARLVEVAPHYDYGPGNLLHARLQCCDWRDHANAIDAIAAQVAAGKRASTPFAFLSVADSAAAQLSCANLYAAHRYRRQNSSLSTASRPARRKISVGYLSADYRDHATAHLIAGLIESHDRSAFEIIGLSAGRDDGSAMRARLERAFDRFIDIRELSDRDAAGLINGMPVDILVDLNGFTEGSRTGVLAFRPAPVQVSYLGYPGTMGLDYVDYLLADIHVIPPAHRAHFTEQIVYLPESYQANDRARATSRSMPTRAAVGLPETGFVFASFNANYKLTPPVFDIWMRLLRQVTGSVLWLYQSNEAVVRNLRREAAMRGVAPERLIFAERVPGEHHLARHCLADLFLDTFPINAHTTASDALWAGLPLLTCTGNAFAGRVAGSLLRALDLNELITDTPEEYERLALQLATTPSLLASIRAKLGRHRATHSLFDAGRLCRHIEAAYAAMWSRRQQGIAPSFIAITPQP